MDIAKAARLMVLIPLPLISFFETGNFKLVSPKVNTTVLSEKELNLNNRQPNQWVNEVFKDNILLNLAYLRNPDQSNKPDWNEIRQDFTYEFRLEPNQVFAFHDDVPEKYQSKLVKTTNAHFNSTEGFLSDGYLFGDGVCHLASLIYWAAKDANLETEAPTNHNFANITDIPREYGVSIYNNPYSKGSNINQNLYITNNTNKLVAFKFAYKDSRVKVSVEEIN
jgi:hypothetical protein